MFGRAWKVMLPVILGWLLFMILNSIGPTSFVEGGQK